MFDTTSSTGTTLPIAGATAADFSPDNLKAFIAAGSNLYVCSAQDSLKKIPLTAPADAMCRLLRKGPSHSWLADRHFCGHRLEHLRPGFRADQ